MFILPQFIILEQYWRDILGWYYIGVISVIVIGTLLATIVLGLLSLLYILEASEYWKSKVLFYRWNSLSAHKDWDFRKQETFYQFVVFTTFLTW